MANRDWAHAKFYSLHLREYPFLVAYWDENDSSKLLFYSMNLACVKLFGYPKGKRDEFIKRHQGENLALLFESSVYENLIVCTCDEVEVELDCYKGFKKTKGYPYCEDQGVMIRFEVSGNIGSLPILNHKSVNEFLTGWMEVFKTSRKIAWGIASAVMALLGFAIAAPPWMQFTPTEVKAAKDGSKEQVEAILTDEVDKLPYQIKHNGITVSKYLDNLDSRQLFTGYIKGIGPLDRKSIEIRSTREDGWKQQLQSHLPSNEYPDGRHHIINIEYFRKKDPNHSLVVMMQKGRIKQLVTYPIYNESRLSGYVAIGLNDDIDKKSMDVVIDRLKSIAFRISFSTSFPG